jgi:hypothetical protein
MIGAAFLLAQLFSVVSAQFGSTRYFCWAPNDYMVVYRMQVWIGDRMLTPPEIQRRYRIGAKGVYQNVVSHLENMLRQYETTYGRGDFARIAMMYSINGSAEKAWIWPPE